MTQPEEETTALDVKVELKKTDNVYSIDAGVEDLVVIQVRANDHPVGLEATRQLVGVLASEPDAWIAHIDEAVAEAQAAEAEQNEEESKDG